MSSWKAIKTAIQTEASQMKKADGFNFDWIVGKRVDLDYSQAKAVFILETPVNVPFEENKYPAKGVTSFEYKNKRRVMMVGRILSDLADHEVEDAIEANDDVLDLALQDIKKQYCGTISSPYCENGVSLIQYKKAYKRPITSKGIYLPFELVVEYEIEYVENRCS